MYHDWECEDYSQAQANLLVDIIKSFQLQNKVILKTMTQEHVASTVTYDKLIKIKWTWILDKSIVQIHYIIKII